MPVIWYDSSDSSFIVRFDDASSTEVALTPGTGPKAIRHEATDQEIADAGLAMGRYTGCILDGDRLVGTVSLFEWGGESEVIPDNSDDGSNLVIGIPVTNVWNVSGGQVSFSYAAMSNPSVTGVPASQSGVIHLQVGGHIEIESERLDDVEIDTHLNNGVIQVFRRMIPTDET